MITPYDVEPNKFIEALAKELEKIGIEKAEFVEYVKSGAHKERPPEQEDFFYRRCAAILRKAYIQGKVGTNKLRRAFGGRKNRGVKPEHKVKAGGKIIRVALQSLEKAGLMQKGPDGKGRVLSPKGRALLDKVAKNIAGSN